MNITKVTKKIHRYNEDGIFVKKNLYVIMDGASSLYPVKTSKSDAAQFITFIKEELKKYQSGDILAYLEQLSQKYYLANYTEDIEAAMMPSCGMVIIQIEKDEIIIYNIGDVEACVITKQEKIFIKQPELEKLDALVLDKMLQLVKDQKMNMLAARKAVNDLLIYNRNLMNQENGYFVFAPRKAEHFKFTKQTFYKKDLLGIFAATDGYASAYKQFGIFDNYQHLYDLDIDIHEVCQKIITITDADPYANQYPRFKKRDDMSAIKIDFRGIK